jgi:lipopolysaccharide transport protein LptA
VALATSGLLAAGGAAGAAATADLKHCPIDIYGNEVKAKVSKTDGSSEWREVLIKACDTEIRADHAYTTRVDIDNSDWKFNGNVRIRSTEQGSRLTSDRAVVQFRNNEIARIDLNGKPAEFEQQRPDSDVVTHGRANEIIYEAGPGTISMQDDVWLSDGSKTYRGQHLVYDIRKQEVGTTRGAESPEPGSDRVHITINPKEMKKDDGKPAPSSPSPPPADAPPPAKP